MSEDGLKPDRDLLNVNFEGYKLSENPLGVVQRELPSPVSTVTLKDEFSYQHVRAHTLHNHLHFDPHTPTSVYWCLKDGSILQGSLCEDKNAISIRTVFHLPMTVDTVARPTNVTMEFVGGNMGVVCAGGNEVILIERHIVEGGSLQEHWETLKKFSISDEDPVQIVTARLYSAEKQVHILCAVLTKPVSGPARLDSSVGVATYKWVRIDDVHSEVGLKDVRDVTVVGAFESKSLALYAAFQFTNQGVELLLINETTPLVENSNSNDAKQAAPASASRNMEQDGHLFSPAEEHCGLGYSSKQTYQWTQSDSDVVVTFKLDSDVGKGDISCIIEPRELVVGLTDGTTLLRGELTHPVDPEASTWTIEGNLLEVTLEKQVEGVAWHGLVKGAEGAREQLPLEDGMESELSPEELEKARKMLQEMTGKDELEASPSKKACRMVEPMLEECDSSDEDANLFVISEKCQLKQRVGFGGRQLVFTAASHHGNHPAYFSLRHDVDAVVWLPHASLPPSSSSRWCHASTFNALGYVQASKRERKFTTCSPNLKYAVISDSTRHVFVYRQPRGVANSAAEHVYSAPKTTSILGLVATDMGVVFVLTDTEMITLQIPDFV